MFGGKFKFVYFFLNPFNFGEKIFTYVFRKFFSIDFGWMFEFFIMLSGKSTNFQSTSG